MLTLATRKAKVSNLETHENLIVRISSDSNRPQPLRAREFFLGQTEKMPDGFMGNILVSDKNEEPSSAPTVQISSDFNYLGDGDIIRIDPEHGHVRVIFRRNSNQNSFLLTERCNHYCLMCSQPPRDIDDGWIFDELIEVIRLMPRDTKEIGFTGGEPTLLGGKFLTLIQAVQSYLPDTALHVLTNGRAFKDDGFCKAVASIGHKDLMFGIPVYADISEIHNYVVQADGAFDETIRGILNLKRAGQKVELRVVLHQQTIPRLIPLVEYIIRNLTFLDHVALMGLEVTGFTKANLPELWIDPYDYKDTLREAALNLEAADMNVSIYNLQHCILSRDIWHLSRNSISDWKNDYLPACQSCSVFEQCGGLFATGMSRVSDYINPL